MNDEPKFSQDVQEYPLAAGLEPVKSRRGRPAGTVEYYRELRLEGAWHKGFVKKLNDMRREGWMYRAVFNLGPIEGVMVLFEKTKKVDDDPIM